MSISKQDWILEQERVDRVISIIDSQIARLENETGQVKGHLIEIKKAFLDEVSVNIDDPADIAETISGVSQQANLLSEREQRHKQSVRQLSQLYKMEHSPYFARIDLQEEGGSEPEPIYIGIGSLLDEDQETFLVYDWRAPVSSLYYDALPGPVSYQAPAGIIEANMHTKRQYLIRDGKIISLFDTSLTIGDEMLQKILGRESESQMRNIVATIQKQQNRIIRNDHSKLLIVQGAAGSGKTSAALQRVAYLLYKHRETLTADEVILFSPNALFSSYISTVLPELGEENMHQTTFQEYMLHRLGSGFKLETPYDQLEELLLSGEGNQREQEIRLKNIKFKASTEFLNLLERYLQLLAHEQMIFKPLTFQGKIIFSKDDLAQLFYDHKHKSLSIPMRMEKMASALLKMVKQRAASLWKEDWVRDAIEYLDKEDYQRAFLAAKRKLKKGKLSQAIRFDDHDLEEIQLRKWYVNRKLKPLRNKIKRYAFLDIPAMYKQIYVDPDRLFELDGQLKNTISESEWEAVCIQTLIRLERKELPYEDATPYLYFKERLRGFHAYPTVQHVLVDEAQDYSPLQLEFIRRMFPRSKMTLLGDWNQAILWHSASQPEMQALEMNYGGQSERIHLRKSYRSTKQIVEFTKQLLKDRDGIEPFERNGDLPQVYSILDSTQTRDVLKNVLLNLQHEHIAILCKTSGESRHVYMLLKEVWDGPVQLLTEAAEELAEGLVVLPVHLAKGVEFDAVIVYDASENNYRREQERKLLYTASTRAMHQLILIALGRVSPFIADANPSSYHLTKIQLQ